jgi:hypothetical protein
MICGTYWAAQSREDGRVTLSGGESHSWPTDVHIRQLATAHRVYLDEFFLDNDGFDELKALAAQTSDEAGLIQTSIGDFALLFLLQHELQHVFDKADGTDRPGPRFNVVLEYDCLADKRKQRWSAEATHDANAAMMAFISCTHKLKLDCGLSERQAKAQAASLVFPGADLALHALQFVEEHRFGTVSAEDAAVLNEFRRHPPSKLRRDSLSRVAYSATTGQPDSALERGVSSDSWRMVAECAASQMRLRDMLIEGYRDFVARGGTVDERAQ